MLNQQPPDDSGLSATPSQRIKLPPADFDDMAAFSGSTADGLTWQHRGHAIETYPRHLNQDSQDPSWDNVIRALDDA